MKFVKGKKAGPGAGTPKRCICAIPGESDVCPACNPKKVARPVQLSAGKPPKPTPNPWIDRRLFDLMQKRAEDAENLCRDLIRVIAVDDGEFLASHDYDYLAAGQAILKGDI